MNVYFEIRSKNYDTLKGVVDIDDMYVVGVNPEPLHYFDKNGDKVLLVEQALDLSPFEYESSFFDQNFKFEIIHLCEKYAKENKTIDKGEYLLIINDGAKVECEILPAPNNLSETNPYIVEIIPKFNGEKIEFLQFMEENSISFNPYGLDDEDNWFDTNNGHLYFEISKDWFEGNDDKEDNLKIFILPEIENIYKQYLTSELCVYSIASRIYEEEHGRLDKSACDKFASYCEQSFEDMDVNELAIITEEEDVERIIKEWRSEYE